MNNADLLQVRDALNGKKQCPTELAYAVMAAIQVAKANWTAEDTKKYGQVSADFVRGTK